MQVLDRLPIMTPEGVAFDITLAGLGSRFLSTLVDLVVQALLITINTKLFQPDSGGSTGVSQAIQVITTFLILFFYPVLFEIRWAGRTPGKRLTGLRVVTMSGGSVNARASVTRNLVRFVDFLPLGYVVGFIVVLVSPKNQRLGDMAAGTVVMIEPTRVRRSKRAMARDAKKLSSMGSFGPMGAAGPGAGTTAASFVLPPGLTIEQRSGWDLSRITKEDMGSIRAFLDRRHGFSVDIRQRLAHHFASAVASKVIGVPLLPPEILLEQIVAAKEMRR